jgi:two-component system, NarL family, response regulator DesR
MSERAAVRCLLADDHPALVAAVSSFLDESGFDVVGPASDGTQTVALAGAEQPEVAVVDYHMPRLGGRELLRRLRSVAPHTRVVLYTADADATLVQEVLAAGADAIVLKDAPLEDLCRAVAAVQAGRTYVDPSLASLTLGGAGGGRTPLTERERDVLQRLSRGRSHADIGGELGISVETVRTHLRKACDKLGAATRTQAVATALRLGLIE